MDPVVIFSFSVFTVGFFLAALLDLVVEGVNVWLSRVPVIDIVDPEIAVTLPLANVKLPPGNRRPPVPEPVPLPLGKLPLGGVPPSAPVRPAPPKPPRAPPANPPAPAPPNPAAHVPDDVGWLIVMDRAATVVLDFFDGVPVTVRQSPTATRSRSRWPSRRTSWSGSS